MMERCSDVSGGTVAMNGERDKSVGRFVGMQLGIGW